MKQSKLLFCTMFFLLFSVGGINVSQAEEKKSYRLHLLYLPGFIESAEEGIGVRLNNEIVKRIEERENIKFDIFFYPTKRATFSFNEKSADVLFAMVLGAVGDDPYAVQSADSIDSAPVVGSGYSIFTLKNKPKLSQLSDLGGKRVGIIRGVTRPQQLDTIPVASLGEVSSMEQNFQKLRAGRIDAILTIKTFGIEEMKRLNVADIHYGKEFNYVFGGYCTHLTQEGAQLVEYFNQAIGEMIKDGTYKAMLKDYPDLSLLK